MIFRLNFLFCPSSRHPNTENRKLWYDCRKRKNQGTSENFPESVKQHLTDRQNGNPSVNTLRDAIRFALDKVIGKNQDWFRDNSGEIENMFNKKFGAYWFRNPQNKKQ